MTQLAANPRSDDAIGPSLRSRRGYSSLELVTAVAIALIASTIGISGIGFFKSGSRVDSAATKFSHALSGARSFAIAHNSYYQVRLSLDYGNFWIDEIDDPLTTPSAIFNPITPKLVHPETIGDFVAIEGIRIGSLSAPLLTGDDITSYSFVFAPDGSALADARVTFHLAKDDNPTSIQVHTVRIYGPTGYNKVFRKQRI